MRAIIALAALTLSACAHQPLITSCLTKEQLAELKSQEPPKIRSRLSGQADADTRVLAGSNLRLRAYGHTLLGVLEVCAK